MAYSKGQELYLECARQAAYIVGNDKVEIGGKSSEVGKEGEEAAGGPKEVLSEKAAFWYEGESFYHLLLYQQKRALTSF